MTVADGHGFSYRNGREVFAAGERKIWRCPVCAWWREWAERRCCACGTPRDATAAPVNRLAQRHTRAA
jgi:rubrerythrin